MRNEHELKNGETRPCDSVAQDSQEIFIKEMDKVHFPHSKILF